MDWLNLGIPLGQWWGINVRLHFTFLIYAYIRASSYGHLGDEFVCGRTVRLHPAARVRARAGGTLVRRRSDRRWFTDTITLRQCTIATAAVTAAINRA